VDEVYPDLVAHSADGQIETVKYQVLDSMLLNEVQRQQTEIGEQREQLRRLEQQNASLLERLDKMEAALGAISRGTSTSPVSGLPAVR
jgi:predicted nuclease with TOPRIM domain